MTHPIAWYVILMVSLLGCIMALSWAICAAYCIWKRRPQNPDSNNLRRYYVSRSGKRVWSGYASDALAAIEAAKEEKL